MRAARDGLFQVVVLAQPKITTAASRMLTPTIIVVVAERPAALHSPVTAPQALDEMIFSDIKIGYPTEGPRRPSLLAPMPYATKLPTQSAAMTKTQPRLHAVRAANFSQLFRVNIKYPQ